MGGSSTTTTSVPPPSQQELDLQSKQLELSQAQLDAIRQQSAFQGKLWDTLGPAFDAQAKLIQQSLSLMPDPNDPVQRARLDREQKIQDLYAEQELQRAQRGGGATDQEIANIKAAADAAIESGGRDIDRSYDDALRQLREEFAPSAGLRATDSPVLFRGDKATAEALRLKGDLTAKIRAGEATARLNAPLGTAQTLTAIGQGQASLADAAQAFTSDLRQAAATNRLQLAGSYGQFVNNAGQFGLGLVQGIGNPTGTALSQMQQSRFANATTTTRKSPGFLDYLSAGGSFLGGVGGAASGLGAVGLISTAELKDILKTYSEEEANSFLEALIAMPVHRWRYKAGVGLDAESIHVGPVAEDWQKLTGYGSSRDISIFDMLGVFIMAVKALNDRITQVEEDAA